MRGLIVLGVIAGLLLTTTAMATGGTLAPRTSDASATALTLPAGNELTDQELAQVTGEFLPVWAAVAIVLAARVAARAAAAAVQGAAVGAHAGAAAEITKRFLEGKPLDPQPLICAMAGGAAAGAWSAGRQAFGAAVSGSVVGTAAAFSCGR